MKTTHALNFFLIGLAMSFSPAYWPEQFAADAGGGETSTIWLLTMGAIQMTLGAVVLSLNGVPRMIQFLSEWEPISLRFELPDVGSALTDSFYARLNDDEEINLALSLQQQLRLGYV